MWYVCLEDGCRFETNSTRNAQNHELETGHEMLGEVDDERPDRV